MTPLGCSVPPPHSFLPSGKGRPPPPPSPSASCRALSVFLAFYPYLNQCDHRRVCDRSGTRSKPGARLKGGAHACAQPSCQHDLGKKEKEGERERKKKRKRKSQENRLLLNAGCSASLPVATILVESVIFRWDAVPRECCRSLAQFGVI